MHEDNTLTLRNMPWLDLGELPVSYNSHKSEAFQVFLVPHDEFPFNLVIKYKRWSQRFDPEKLNKYYKETVLEK